MSEIGIIESLTRRVEALEQADDRAPFLVDNLKVRVEALEKAGDRAPYTPPQSSILVDGLSLKARVEELERDTFSRMKGEEWQFDYDAVKSLARVMVDATGMLGSTLTRLSKLEGAANKPATSAYGPAVDYLTEEVESRLQGFLSQWKAQNRIPDYMTHIDPDASPSGIPFEVALMYLKAGRRVSHPQMEEGSYVVMTKGGGFNHVLLGDRTIKWVVESMTLLSDAWSVIPKEEKP